MSVLSSVDFRSYILLTAAACIFLPSSAHAYVDPSSGSVIVTTIVGLIAAVAYTLRKFFYNLKGKLFGHQEQKDDRSDDN